MTILLLFALLQGAQTPAPKVFDPCNPPYKTQAPHIVTDGKCPAHEKELKTPDGKVYACQPPDIPKSECKNAPKPTQPK